MPRAAVPPPVAWAASLAVGFAPMESPAAGQGTPLGPLTFEEGAPLQRLGYTGVTESAEVLPGAGVSASLWFAYANIFERDSSATHQVVLDLERLIASATVRAGLGKGVEIGVRAAWENTGGGILDPVIVGFHNAFGLGNHFRERYPYGEHQVTFVDARGRLRLAVPRREWALTEVRLFGKWRVFRDVSRQRVLSFRVSARIPMVDDPFGTERADVAVAAMARREWRGWHGHGVVEGFSVRTLPELRDVLRGWGWLLAVALERPLGPGASGVIQFVASPPLTRPLGDPDMDHAVTDLVVGVVGRAGNGWRWEASLQEDVPPRGPSLDFQLQVGVTRVW
ncbi:MAG: DUF3187 family protein [Gemmatimonadota bacterium]|nr:DUF3187 family protein [Gemmatimonadota bacterium]MDH5757955.1 DUF3187 family protein [Gemmatimonadota bacterium]